MYKHHRVGKGKQDEAKDTFTWPHLWAEWEDWRQLERQADGWTLVLDGSGCHPPPRELLVSVGPSAGRPDGPVPSRPGPSLTMNFS